MTVLCFLYIYCWSCLRLSWCKNDGRVDKNTSIYQTLTPTVPVPQVKLTTWLPANQKDEDMTSWDMMATGSRAVTVVTGSGLGPVCSFGLRQGPGAEWSFNPVVWHLPEEQVRGWGREDPVTHTHTLTDWHLLLHTHFWPRCYHMSHAPGCTAHWRACWHLPGNYSMQQILFVCFSTLCDVSNMM